MNHAIAASIWLIYIMNEPNSLEALKAVDSATEATHLCIHLTWYEEIVVRQSFVIDTCMYTCAQLSLYRLSLHLRILHI